MTGLFKEKEGVSLAGLESEGGGEGAVGENVREIMKD